LPRFKDKAARRLTCSPFDKRSEQFASIGVAALSVDRGAAGRPGLNFASVGQASDSGSGRTWWPNRPVDSADHTCGDYSVCRHVSLMVGKPESTEHTVVRSGKSKESQMWQATCQDSARLALRECRINLRPRVLAAEMLLS
jgi:hypothetical protein